MTVEFVNLRQIGNSNPFFVIYQNTHVVSIWQKNFMFDEMCFKMKCTRESDIPTPLGTNCISTVNFILFSWLPVRYSHRLARDFAASLTEKCQSAMSITVLSTNFMPHKIDPYTSHNTLKVCITEWPRFYLILSIFSTHFQIIFTAVVKNWFYLFKNMWIWAFYHRNYSLLIWYRHELAAKMYEVLGEMSGKHSMQWIQLLPRIGKPIHKFDFFTRIHVHRGPLFHAALKKRSYLKKESW